MKSAMKAEERDRLGSAQRADEDEVGRYGMRTDEDADNEGRMRLICTTCGETNRIKAPKGFKFTVGRTAEDEDEGGLRSLRYTCATCGETNRAQAPLARESAAVRAFREAYRRPQPW